jgi:hypothetical protein
VTAPHDETTDAPGTDVAAAATDSPATPDTSDGPDEQQLERLRAAIGALDDTVLRDAVQALPEPSRVELASTLQLPPATMHLGTALAPLLRRKLRSAAPHRQLTAAFALTEPVNDEMVHALGARHDDPSRDDVLGVLPGVLDRYGAPIVTLLVAAYAASGAAAQAVMAELLATDERLAIGDAVDDEAAPLVPADASASTETEAEREARREERKAAKAARRTAQQHERAAQQAAHAARRTAQRKAKRNVT